jgi:hypothetical protein
VGKLSGQQKKGNSGIMWKEDMIWVDEIDMFMEAMDTEVIDLCGGEMRTPPALL